MTTPNLDALTAANCLEDDHALRPVSAPAIVPFPRWRRARDRACAALLAGESSLLVTGPTGTGKTALLHEIARILRYAGWDAEVHLAGLPDQALAPKGGNHVLLLDE